MPSAVTRLLCAAGAAGAHDQAQVGGKSYAMRQRGGAAGRAAKPQRPSRSEEFKTKEQLMHEMGEVHS